MWFSTSSGRIELQLTRNEAHIGYHQGQCDRDIDDLRRVPRIARQLRRIDATVLKTELAEYGAWSDDELNDHEANLSRLLWLACGDIVEAA